MDGVSGSGKDFYEQRCIRVLGMPARALDCLLKDQIYEG